MTVRKRQVPNQAGRRRGAAMVELAVTLPLILTIVLGTIEITSIIYCKQALQSSAQECGRIAAKTTSSDEDVQQQFENIAQQLELRNATVTTSPASIEELEPGTRIHVVVQADAPANAFVAGNFYRSNGILATCWIVKEL